MELKVYAADNVAELKANNNKKKTIDNSSTFSNVLNEVKSKSTDTSNTKLKDLTSNVEDEIKTGNPLIDGLPNDNKGKVLEAIGKLNEVFGVNMLGNQDQFFNKDGTINIERTLNLYGDNVVTSNDFNKLSSAINTLHDNGLISKEDYFYAIKWIATKKEVLRIKMHSLEDDKSITGNLISKSKK